MASRRQPVASRNRPSCTGGTDASPGLCRLKWQDAVIRAAITLKLCQYEETGAIVAAMTTSIPEAPNSGRNWDYCYCWLRDAFFVVRALNSPSEVGTMESHLNWLYNVVRGSKGGRRAAALRHWPGARPSRKPFCLMSVAIAAWGRCGSATRRRSTFSTTYGNVVLGRCAGFSRPPPVSIAGTPATSRRWS